MDEETLIIGLAAVAVGFVLYKKAFPNWTAETGQYALSNVGGSTTVRPVPAGSGAIQRDEGVTYIDMNSANENTTFLVRDSEWKNLNFAQRTLITLDRVVPGNWLTKAVLS